MPLTQLKNPVLSPQFDYETLHQLVQSIRREFRKGKITYSYQLIEDHRRKWNEETHFVELRLLDILETEYHLRLGDFDKCIEQLEPLKNLFNQLSLYHPKNKSIKFLKLINNQVFAYYYGDIYLQVESMDCCYKMHEIGEEIGATFYQRKAWYILGDSFFLEQDYEKAIECLNNAKEGLPEEDENLGSIYNTLAACYRETKEFDKAWEAFDRAIENDKRHNNFAKLSLHLCNYASTLTNLGRTKEGKEKLMEADNCIDLLAEIDSEQTASHRISTVSAWLNYYVKVEEYQKAKELFEEIPNFHQLMSNRKLDLYERMQVVYTMLGEQEIAVENFEIYSDLITQSYSKHRAEFAAKQETYFRTAKAKAEAEYNLKLFEKEQQYRQQIEELLEKEKAANLALQREKNRVDLKSLCKQMDPHFMFNSLNSISSYVLENDKKSANKYLSRFSKLMRQTVDYSLKDVIALEDEIEILEIYMDLEVLRFGNLFGYEIRVHEDIDISSVCLPPMLLQPQVENAIWHGLRHRPKRTGGKIILSFRIEEESLICQVQDNGIGREAAKALNTLHRKEHQSVGSDNIRKRIEILNSLYEGTFSLKTDNHPTTEDDMVGTCVTLTVPI